MRNYHHQANGFFNSKGVSRYLPPAYTWIEKQFFNHVKRAGRSNEISIEEYGREGWTYHAKGLWASLQGNDDISLTLIGSPNFGHRSSQRDLEAQAFVITENKRLQSALHKVFFIFSRTHGREQVIHPQKICSMIGGRASSFTCSTCNGCNIQTKGSASSIWSACCNSHDQNHAVEKLTREKIITCIAQSTL